MAELHEDWAGIVKLKCGACDEDNTIFESKSITLRLEEECRIPCPACNGTGYRKPEPQEVNDWLAVEVKGWTSNDTLKTYWWDASGPIIHRADFDPLTIADHALMLAQSVCDGPRSSHIIIPVLTPGGNKVGVWAFRAVAYPFPPKDLLAHLDYCSSDALRLQADTFCEALCLAAAKARVEARDHE